MSNDTQPTRSWTLLTNHGRLLLLIASDPDIKLRDLAAAAGITERAAGSIVSDPTLARKYTLPAGSSPEYGRNPATGLVLITRKLTSDVVGAAVVPAGGVAVTVKV